MYNLINKFVLAGLLLSGAGIISGVYIGIDSLVAWSTISAWGFGVYSIIDFFIISIIGCVRKSVSVFNRFLVFNFILSAVGFSVIFLL